MNMYQKVREFLLSGRRVSSLENRVKALQNKTELVNEQIRQLIEGQNQLIMQLSEENVNYHLEDPPPAFPLLKSQLCTYQQMLTPGYADWCRQSNGVIPISANRKDWEFCYILQALKESGKLTQGARGLGFAVGLEPLPAMFVKMGCRIVASDLDTEAAVRKGWASGDVQHAGKLQDLNRHGICPPELFARNTDFRAVDMNYIPKDLREFDFLWSSCSLEHLGSIDAGIRYIVNAMDCLKPGGVAVHTTEFNLSSDIVTADCAETVLFRKRDILRIRREAEAAGYRMAPLTFNAGTQPADRFIDVPPYLRSNYHLKLLLGRYVTTSIGMILYKDEAVQR